MHTQAEGTAKGSGPPAAAQGCAFNLYEVQNKRMSSPSFLETPGKYFCNIKLHFF